MDPTRFHGGPWSLIGCTNHVVGIFKGNDDPSVMCTTPQAPVDGINVTRVSLRLTPLEVSGSVASSEYRVELLPDLVACADWEPKDWNNRTLVDLGDIMDSEEEDKRIAAYHHSRRDILGSTSCISPLARIHGKATSAEQS